MPDYSKNFLTSMTGFTPLDTDGDPDQEDPKAKKNQDPPPNKMGFKTGDFQFESTLNIHKKENQSPANFKTGDFEFHGGANKVPMSQFKKQDPLNFNTGDFEFKGGIKQTQKASSGDPSKDRIQLPDYQNSKDRLRYAQDFSKKYGGLMQGRGDTPLRINESPDTDEDTSRNISLKAVKGLGLDAALLYSSAMEEGMSGLYPDKNGEVAFSGDEKYPVNGFVNFGLDNFADAYPGLVKKGYLPADFNKNFSKVVNTNEKGEKVNSANFKNAETALKAKAAMIKSSEDEVNQFAKKNDIKLSPKSKDFFTLINYNAGSGNAQKMLQSYNQKGYLKEDAFLNKRPDESWKEPYENVIRRIKMAEALKQEGLFD